MHKNLPASWTRPLLAVLCACLALAAPGRAAAGGGPENVLLVVNSNSPGSLTIANHYIQLRQIPAGNVLMLALAPSPHSIHVGDFRQTVLKPILEAIDKRRLGRQIDYLVYSSDFPWCINLKSDVDRFTAELQKTTPSEPWPAPYTPTGSINGLTYLLRMVMADDKEYFSMSSNQYLRRPIDETKQDVPTLGFSHGQRFGPNGELVDSGGSQYMLSTMLGVTVGRGNTVDEVLAYLRRSAAADGTQPRGTIYFVRNDTVRSKVRDSIFPGAVELLKPLGVSAEIVDGKLPMQRKDVMGTVTGWPQFTWPSSGSTILPGAICDNFTSFGGVMWGGSQTPLTEFLRYGAAGSSGTVTEPFAILNKFPLPLVHVHYARGCTLAEAFYQSVFAPYQLLIVGDPLCRPWANIPKVEVRGAEPGATVQGTLTLTPSAAFPRPSQVERFELFIDGWLRATCAPGESLSWDTARLADGHHELRVVAIQSGPIQTQGRAILPITTANHGHKIAVVASPEGKVRPGQALWVAANSPGSSEIAVLHNSRLLGKIAGDQGRVQIDPAALGFGPVQLRVVGLSDAGPLQYVWAKPIDLTVEGHVPANRPAEK